ncbi:MAG: nuclear transport factor 2 family protein [Sphingomonadaceae bacterium]
MKASVTPFQLFLDQYQAAVLAKDSSAFAALYDEEVEVFDTWERWSISGRDAWRTTASAWFAGLGAETLVACASEVHCSQAGELVLGHALMTYTTVSASGERLRALSKRITVGLRRSGGRWKVFHEHSSVPVDHITPVL